MLWFNLIVDTVNPDNVFKIVDDIVIFRFVRSGGFFRVWCLANDFVNDRSLGCNLPLPFALRIGVVFERDGAAVIFIISCVLNTDVLIVGSDVWSRVIQRNDNLPLGFFAGALVFDIADRESVGNQVIVFVLMLWFNLTVDTVNPDNVFEIVDDVVVPRLVGSSWRFRLLGSSGVRNGGAFKRGKVHCKSVFSVSTGIILWVESFLNFHSGHVTIKNPSIYLSWGIISIL